MIFQRRTVHILTIALGMLFTNALRADQILLKNGDRVSGTIESLQDGKITLHSDYAGTLNIDWHSVEGIKSDSPITLILENGDRVTGVANYSAGEIQLESSTLGTLSFPVSSIKQAGRGELPEGSARYQAAQEKIQSISGELETTQQQLADTEKQLLSATEISNLWSGNIALQGSVRLGNRDELDANFSAEAKRDTKNEVLTLRANAAYGETENVVDKTELRGQLNQRVFFTDTYYVFGDILLEHDRFESIDFRMDGTAGAGYEWFNTDRGQLLTDLGLGLTYEVDDFGNSTTEPSARIGLEYNQTIFEESQFTQLITLYPSLGNIGDFRLITQSDLSTPISDSLSWLISIINEYDNDPPRANIKKNDLSVRTGIQYNF